VANPSLEAFKKIVTVDWPAHQEREARAHLLRVANDGHQKVMNDAQMRSGVKPDFDAYANTPGNANLQSVKLPGPIVFRYRYIREVLLEALKQLQAASPVGTGAYQRSHQIFINGALVPGVPASVKASDEFMIANTRPYSRKIELGKTKSGRNFVISVPNRVYERAFRRLRAKFGQLVKIEYAFVSLPGGYSLKGSRRGGKRARSGAMAYPALIISLS